MSNAENSFDVQTTVGQIVASKPGLARVFEKIGIDYCCGGKKPLAQACAEKGLDPKTVVLMLSAQESLANAPAVDAAAMSLTQLCDHIQATHHAYLRQDMPRLRSLAGKVVRAHGNKDSRLSQVERTLENLQAEMDAHMAKEEQVLFPMIRQLEAGKSAPAFHCGSIANPIRVMEMEHDSAGNALETMHRLTDAYTPPADACNTYRALLAGLQELEADMHQHVHKENNVLFPQAVNAERLVPA